MSRRGGHLRYLRAHTSFRALCPTCGEQLIFLRWGHEQRCDAFVTARDRRLLHIGLALLVFGVLLFVTPFFASP